MFASLALSSTVCICARQCILRWVLLRSFAVVGGVGCFIVSKLTSLFLSGWMIIALVRTCNVESSHIRRHVGVHGKSAAMNKRAWLTEIGAATARICAPISK